VVVAGELVGLDEHALLCTQRPQQR
jgi:hypothetical protein